MQSKLFLCPLSAEECTQVQHFNTTYNLANWANSIYRKKQTYKNPTKLHPSEVNDAWTVWNLKFSQALWKTTDGLF